MTLQQLYQDIYQRFREKKDEYEGYDFQESPVGSATPSTPTFAKKLKWWTLDRPGRLNKIRKDRDRRQQDIINIKTVKTSPPANP